MTDILLIIIILLLAYLIYFLKGKSGDKKVEETKQSYSKVLPDYLNKSCEIIVKEPLVSIDIMFSVKGILIDYDEEWVMLKVQAKKKASIKMFRIENINSIKEIR